MELVDDTYLVMTSHQGIQVTFKLHRKEKPLNEQFQCFLLLQMYSSQNEVAFWYSLTKGPPSSDKNTGPQTNSDFVRGITAVGKSSVQIGIFILFFFLVLEKSMLGCLPMWSIFTRKCSW